MSKNVGAPEAKLGELHAAVAQDLLADLTSDDADARRAARRDAIKFLKDNGIESVADRPGYMRDLKNILPDEDEDEDTSLAG